MIKYRADISNNFNDVPNGRRMKAARAVATLLGCLLAAGCAGTPDEAEVAQAVEPSLRAAAITAEAASDYRGAAQHWRTLYQRHPEDKGLALSLARTLRYSGQPQQAADVMQAALARLGRDPDLVTETGKDYLADERLGLAQRSLEEARKLAPQRWDIPSAMGVCFDLQGRAAEAAEAYAQALALSPDNPEVLNNLALSQALSGKLREAVATLRHADDQPSAGTQVRQNLAMLLALSGDATAAERLARHDLPPEMARANAEIFRKLSEGVRRSN